MCLNARDDFFWYNYYRMDDYMRKLKLMTILLLILMVPSIKALSCDKTYLVQTVSGDDTTEFIGCTDNYNEARTMMREYPSTVSKVAAIFNGTKIINARYAVVNFTGTAETVNVYKENS